MPVEVKFSDDGRGVFYIGSGMMHASDIMAADSHLFRSEARFRRLRYQLTDLTRVEGGDFSADEMRSIIQWDKEAANLNPHLVVAIVGSRDLVYGLSRMYQILVDVESGPFRAIAVRTFEEATSWIQEQTGLEVCWPVDKETIDSF